MDINQKILQLEEEIKNLKNNEIRRLEDELFMLKQEVRIANNDKVITPARMQEFDSSEISHKIAKQPVAQQKHVQPVQETTQKKTVQQKPVKQKIDLENKLGQNIMGILASLLIFIGLGLFVVLIYDYLTDPLKVLGMYTLSFSILGLGLFLFRKKSNFFSLSLTGCGIGSIYISILMTNVYFNYIGDSLMYGLIVAWLAGIICLSSKFKDELITTNTISIIGQLGIFISVVLGAGNFETTPELFLISFFMIATSTLHWLLTKGANKTILRNISILTVSISTVSIANNLSDKFSYMDKQFLINPITLGILAVVVIAYNLIVNVVYYDNNTSKPWFKSIVIFLASIFTTISAGEFYYVMTRILDSNNRINEILLLTGVMLIIFIIAEIKEKAILVRIATFALFNFFLIQLVAELDVIQYVGLSLMFVPFLVLGYAKKDALYTIAGYMYLAFDAVFLMGTWSLDSPSWGMLEYFIIFILIAGSYGYMLYKKELYNIGYKVLNYFIFLVATGKMFILLDFNHNLELAYVVITLINVFAYSSIFVCDWRAINGAGKADNKVETSTSVICNLTNHFLTLVGLISIYITNSEFWHFAMIIALTGACFVGSYNLLQRFKDTKWVGFYVGIKATIYINAIFYSFSYLADHSYLSSISSLALAVIAILIGFNIEVKSLRVYGLVLSMLSIFKLLLIDIQYDNSIGRVVSFILAGILCFGINFLYNVASKKMKK